MRRSLAIALLLTGILASPIIYAGQDKEDKKTSNKKNSDVDNIGNRDINKHSINFTSLEKEQQLGRELAADGVYVSGWSGAGVAWQSPVGKISGVSHPGSHRRCPP